jgi:hypothetical protein
MGIYESWKETAAITTSMSSMSKKEGNFTYKFTWRMDNIGVLDPMFRRATHLQALSSIFAPMCL